MNMGQMVVFTSHHFDWFIESLGSHGARFDRKTAARVISELLLLSWWSSSLVRIVVLVLVLVGGVVVDWVSMHANKRLKMDTLSACMCIVKCKSNVLQHFESISTKMQSFPEEARTCFSILCLHAESELPAEFTYLKHSIYNGLHILQRKC